MILQHNRLSRWFIQVFKKQLQFLYSCILARFQAFSAKQFHRAHFRCLTEVWTIGWPCNIWEIVACVLVHGHVRPVRRHIIIGLEDGLSHLNRWAHDNGESTKLDLRYGPIFFGRAWKERGGCGPTTRLRISNKVISWCWKLKVLKTWWYVGIYRKPKKKRVRREFGRYKITR